MGEGEKGKIDQCKLPKLPLGVARRSLVELRLWIRERIQDFPSPEILDQNEGDRQKGKDHDESLDRICQSDAVEATQTFEDKNEPHDNDDGVSRTGIQSKNTIEDRLDSNLKLLSVSVQPAKKNG